MQQQTFYDRLVRAYKKHPVTFILLSINTIMAIIASILSQSLFTYHSDVLINLGALVPSLITNQGEYYRLLTAMFLHGSILHFLMNSYFLYIIGGFVEDLLGKVKYITIYMIAGLGSSLLVWLMSMNSNVPTIGASGALFGIMGALLILTYQRPRLFTPYGIRSIRSLVVINVIFTFIAPNISIYGHLGGFLTGIGLMYLMLTSIKGPKPRKEQRDDTHHGNYVIDSDDVSDDDIYYTN